MHSSGKKKNGIIEQFAHGLGDYSSQYGSDKSISYVVKNILGSPRCYPSYGDYTDACVLRTYGLWWKHGPDADSVSDDPNDGYFSSDDFIELLFEQKVYVDSVHIYETYNPGAIVRVAALKMDADRKSKQWHVMWEQPRGKLHVVPKSARIFSPHLRKLDFPTNVIRLEFIHDLLDYYTEIDAVKLVGHTDVDVDQIGAATLSTELSDFRLKLDNLSLEEPSDRCFIYSMPDEILDIIIGYLSVKDQGRIACTSKRFQQRCYDGYYHKHYQYLNLKPYWLFIDNAALAGFTKKCCNLKALNLSWCGSHDMITETGFITFLKNCDAKKLQSLKLESCPFLDDSVLQKTLPLCMGLTELSLAGSLVTVSSKSIQLISMASQLKRLNLYRTSVDVFALVAICRMCRELEYLNIGACPQITDCNTIMSELAECCPKIKALDLWRSNSLTEEGINHLAECHNLESLDVGWCRYVHCHHQLGKLSCITLLAENCSKLRKLFLTANRTVTDIELNKIADNCKDLEQLDILGSNAVSFDGVEKVLVKCKKIKFFDISFCGKIDFQQHKKLKDVYTSCNLKKSFQQ